MTDRDWADEIGIDICGPLPHAKYVATALRSAFLRGQLHEREECAKVGVVRNVY